MAKDITNGWCHWNSIELANAKYPNIAETYQCDNNSNTRTEKRIKMKGKKRKKKTFYEVLILSPKHESMAN